MMVYRQVFSRTCNIIIPSTTFSSLEAEKLMDDVVFLDIGLAGFNGLIYDAIIYQERDLSMRWCR